MVISVLVRGALLHLVWDLKAAQINVQRSLIHELMLYKFGLGHNTVEATKNIDDHSTETRWFKIFGTSCKGLDNQARSSRPKTVDL